jgi:hypothetical protein
MIRLFGFLVGSTASIGLFLLVLGMPDIRLGRQLINDAQIETVTETAKNIKTDLEAVASEVVDEVKDVVAEQVSEPLPEQLSEQVAGIPPASPDDGIAAPEPVAHDPEQPIHPPTPQQARIIEPAPESETPGATQEPTEQDVRWHSFWNPFHSRIAAEGFVGQLEKVTGLDYRVVKIKTGVYEVTFAYESDAERRNKISRIAAATGLDLPES